MRAWARSAALNGLAGPRDPGVLGRAGRGLRGDPPAGYFLVDRRAARARGHGVRSRSAATGACWAACASRGHSHGCHQGSWRRWPRPSSGRPKASYALASKARQRGGAGAGRLALRRRPASRYTRPGHFASTCSTPDHSVTFQQNSSLVWCDQTMEAAVIDPGGDLDVLLAEAQRLGLHLKAIWLTHASRRPRRRHGRLAQSWACHHRPHPGDQFWIDGLPQQSQMFGFPPALHFTPTRWLHDGETVTIGRTRDTERAPLPGATRPVMWCSRAADRPLLCRRRAVYGSITAPTPGQPPAAN